jgi:uncharacterized protein (TIGR02453 family)
VPARFPGFPPAALSFFRSLERNNRREWFQARKDAFDRDCKTPMNDLVAAVASEMDRFARPYVPADPKKSIYRIYRDTRFSEDKTPYKTHIAAIFTRQGLDKRLGGGLYFSVSYKEVEVAGGVYMPGPEELLSIRTHLAGNHQEFEKLVSSKSLKKLLGDLQGESLTRVPKGFDASHPAAGLIKKKQWVYYTILDPAVATTPKLLGEIVKRFEAMTPVVEFLNAPLVARKRKSAAAFLV